MSVGVWAQEAIFTQVWVSRYETYRFSRVDGLSTDTSVLGRHILALTLHLFLFFFFDFPSFYPFLFFLIWIHGSHCAKCPYLIWVRFCPETIYFFSVQFILNELNSNNFLTSDIFVKISSLESLATYHPENHKNILTVSKFDETFLGH